MADSETISGLGSRLGGVLKRSVGGVVNGAKGAKLRLEITSLNGSKQDLFAEIGKKVYVLYESGLVRNGELLSLCSRLRELDLEVADKERYLSALGADEEPARGMPPAPYEGGIEDYPSDDRF